MNRITGNIAVLVRFMRRVDDGDFNARVEGKGFDEMQLLAQGFNELLDRIGDYSVVFGQSKSRRPKRNYVYYRPRSNLIFCLTHWNPLMG